MYRFVAFMLFGLIIPASGLWSCVRRNTSGVNLENVVSRLSSAALPPCGEFFFFFLQKGAISTNTRSLCLMDLKPCTGIAGKSLRSTCVCFTWFCALNPPKNVLCLPRSCFRHVVGPRTSNLSGPPMPLLLRVLCLFSPRIGDESSHHFVACPLFLHP